MTVYFLQCLKVDFTLRNI